MDADLLPRRAGLTPEKITREHQQRLAIIYIRQSTPQQVERNQESTKLQYALVDRAFHFGWARETIVTIDDDLGRSGSTVEGRLGFQRLVAEVGLGHVGLVLGIEMSRLARSCRDWQRARIPWLATAVLVVLAPYFERGRAGAELPVDGFNSQEAVDCAAGDMRAVRHADRRCRWRV